jgi:hypothetical protein
MDWLKDYGALLRAKYGDIDLTNYNYDLVREWADRGVPDALELVARSHPVRTVTIIDGGWSQACDLVANGYPVIVGSSQGFADTYDSDGFNRPRHLDARAAALGDRHAQPPAGRESGQLLAQRMGERP